MFDFKFSDMKLRIIILLLLLVAILNSCYKIDTKKVQQFSRDQQLLIMDAENNSPMRVFKINKPNDSLILRTICEDVVPDSTDKILDRLIKRMYATVRDSINDGVGIAAPQVGITKNIIWVQRFDKAGEPFEVYLNPKILQYSILAQTRREGCLSIPDRRDTLQSRSYAILLEHINFKNERKMEMIEGFTAIIFQHEIDHLNGILFTDYVGKKPESSILPN